MYLNISIFLKSRILSHLMNQNKNLSESRKVWIEEVFKRQIYLGLYKTYHNGKFENFKSLQLYLSWLSIVYSVIKGQKAIAMPGSSGCVSSVSAEQSLFGEMHYLLHRNSS